MIAGIHRALPAKISYEAISASLLKLLVSPENSETGTVVQAHRNRLVKKLRCIIRSLAALLGSSFDGQSLVDALLAHDIDRDSWSHRDDEDKARLMFQCVTLSVASFISDSSPADNDVRALRGILHATRKKLLTWCCTTYCCHARHHGQLERLDYFHTGLGVRKSGHNVPNWLRTVRCLLFLEKADSSRMKKFLVVDSEEFHDDAEWLAELPRIRLCYEYGGDLNDELFWIVLNSVSTTEGIDSEMAVQILEHLLERCGKSHMGELTFTDPHAVWELYNLVVYSPELPVVASDPSKSDGCEVELWHDLPRYEYCPNLFFEQVN
jgi:hypothetical protein